MKKLLLFISGLTISLTGFSQLTITQKVEKASATFTNVLKAQKTGNLHQIMGAMLPTGVLHLEYDTAIAAYDTVGRTLMANYDDGIPLMQTEQKYKNGNFVNEQKFTYFAQVDTAAMEFHLDSAHLHIWDTTANKWIHAFRLIAKYTNTKKLDMFSTYINTAIFSLPFGFIKSEVEMHYYDGNDFEIAIGKREADPAKAFALAMSDSTSFTNDSKGNHLTELQLRYNSDNNKFYNNQRYTNIFDNNNNAIVITYESYDTTQTQWWYMDLDSMQYDAKNREIVDISYFWDNGNNAWTTYPVKYTTAYDSKNRTTLEMSYAFDGNQYRASYRKTYNFTTNGDPDFDVVERSNDGTTWILEHLDDKDVYLYTVGIGIAKTNSNSVLSVFPNPSHGIINIQVKNGNFSNNATVVVMDVIGNVVKTINLNGNSNTVELNFSDIAAGVYFMQINNNNHQVIEKITIAK